MKVSIITINLNNAKGLEKTLESVAKQSYRMFEHIIIDGGSTDNSMEMKELFDSERVIWESGPDRGIYHAQNKGWKRATGQFCIFLNSGDRFFNEHTLKYLVTRANANTIVYGNIYVELDAGVLILKEYPAVLNDSFFNYDTPPHCCSLIPLRLLRAKGGYDEELRICADWKFFRQVNAARRANFIHVPEALSIFDSKGVSSKPENQNLIYQEREKVKNEEQALSYKLQLRFNKVLSAVGLWKILS